MQPFIARFSISIEVVYLPCTIVHNGLTENKNDGEDSARRLFFFPASDDSSPFDDDEDYYYIQLKSASSKKDRRKSTTGARSAGKRASTDKRGAR